MATSKLQATLRTKQGTHNPTHEKLIEQAKSEEGIRTSFVLPESLMTRLKIKSATDKKSMRDIVIEALEKHMN